MKEKIVIWWGRFDGNYSRNRILRQQFVKLGYKIIDFKPRISCLGFYEALLTLKIKPDFIWVPCFRHRDVKSAGKWSNKINVPLIFDPLISVWDKKIREKKKYSDKSFLSNFIKSKEKYTLSHANLVVADTELHAEFFAKHLGVNKAKLSVINVGAEEDIFSPAKKKQTQKIEILFYGSFLELHGVDVLIKAARMLDHDCCNWLFIGDGPKLAATKQMALGLTNVQFKKPVPYKSLPKFINQADVLLGIFSNSEKARNVIPNKVFQSLACGRPIITRFSEAYPKNITGEKDGIFFVKPNDPEAIVNIIKKLVNAKSLLISASQAARKTYKKNFSEVILNKQLKQTIQKLSA